MCNTITFFLAPSLLDSCLVVLEKKILKFFDNFFLLFCYYIQFEKGMVIQLNKLETPTQKDVLCQVWLIFAEWFLRRSFRSFALRKGDGLSFDKTNSLHLRKLCARFLLNCASGSKEEIENIKNWQTASGDQESSSKISAQVSLKRQDWQQTNFDQKSSHQVFVGWA